MKMLYSTEFSTTILVWFQILVSQIVLPLEIVQLRSWPIHTKVRQTTPF